ncbi:MAG: 3'(2'),5'-bisphosphate nucleotidase CysQ [Woeseiaceae bacterium]
MDIESDIDVVCKLAERAGKAIMRVYESDFDVISKRDASPLTQADMQADKIIREGLSTHDSRIPMISEETALPSFEERQQWHKYWLIDPLDGTKEFVNRNGEFTVNIALIEAGFPVIGVVHVPVTGITYWGGIAYGAFRAHPGSEHHPIRVSDGVSSPRVVTSRSHGTPKTEAWLERLGDYSVTRTGSSLKFCAVAEAQADVYPRFGPTSEWDTAAAQAVVEGAGGQVTTWDGHRLAYNTKPDMLNPDFVVSGGVHTRWLDI